MSTASPTPSDSSFASMGPVVSDTATIEHNTGTDTLRVLHVINGEYYSGAERVQDLLAASLPEFGFSAGFACVKPEQFPEKRNYKQAPLYDVGMRNRFDLRPARRIAEVAMNENYRLLHAHTPRSLLVAARAARLCKLPLIYHVHSPTSRDSTRRFRNWLNNRLERWSLRQANRLITVSNSLGQHMQQEGFASEMIDVVPNGVPVVQDLQLRDKPTQHWTLGTIALFRPRKGTEVLLRAMASLRRDGHDVRLRAVGPCESEQYKSDLQALAGELNLSDAIHWVGFTSDVNAELSEMDIMVLPSLFGEGLPMVVLEAMAAGVPVVATRVEGTPEAVRDGVDGVLANPNDPDDLARALSEIINGTHDWTKLRDSAVSRHNERFSDRAMAQGVANVYQDVLEI